ncbi:GNAT family N-acetyltransferase [Alteribacillus sp. HJP-4]|uniref:GNAT family N-acetyltransferase n=1 Tax=Alteribacillus sp. HJP-4 TaxID=2775394 RepID=UPI0035CCF779
MTKELLQETPWDKRALEMDTYQLTEYSEEALKLTDTVKGHFTIKVNPLDSKELLHQYGFYFTDTLLTPTLRIDHFIPYRDEKVDLVKNVKREDVLAISEGVYQHGRFHRDFKVDKRGADKRYDNWLNQLYDEDEVWGFSYNGELAGFFALSGPDIRLQAFKPEFQGRGLAKYFWTAALQTMIDRGHTEIPSPISSINLAMINLLSSLGFRFKSAVDVYHKLNNQQ